MDGKHISYAVILVLILASASIAVYGLRADPPAGFTAAWVDAETTAALPDETIVPADRAIGEGDSGAEPAAAMEEQSSAGKPGTAAIPEGLPANADAPAGKTTAAAPGSPKSGKPSPARPPVVPSPVVSRAVSANTSKYPLASKINGSYGQFHFRDLAGGRIEIDPQWVQANIVTITLPGLNRTVQVHRKAADNFIKAFTLIKNGTTIIDGRTVPLLSLIKTMDGTWVPRHVNWSPSRGLSNHSWGTAIDINAASHFRCVNPAAEPENPNLILWRKAFQPAGFSWGNSYGDAMHYELLD